MCSANVIICLVERVKWFQDCALRDRVVEEVEMLEEEFAAGHLHIYHKNSIYFLPWPIAHPPNFDLNLAPT
jgi:hypothetical protein